MFIFGPPCHLSHNYLHLIMPHLSHFLPHVPRAGRIERIKRAISSRALNASAEKRKQHSGNHSGSYAEDEEDDVLVSVSMIQISSNNPNFKYSNFPISKNCTYGNICHEKCPARSPFCFILAIYAPLERPALEPEHGIQDLLGEGSFGKVYKGFWKGTLVAIKTLVVSATPLNLPGGAGGKQ